MDGTTFWNSARIAGKYDYLKFQAFIARLLSFERFSQKIRDFLKKLLLITYLLYTMVPSFRSVPISGQ